MFRFVADETRYDPYPGILRGATGTLWTRAGNSADRALLLASLLTAAEREVRFVTGRLDASSVAALMSASEVDAESVRASTLAAVTGGAAANGSVAPTPPDDPEARAVIGELPAAMAANDAAARTWLGQGIGTIVDALAANGISLPSQSASLPAMEQEQHVWLQLADGNGWIDLDPSLPGAEPGRALTAVDATFTELPADWHHWVGFRAVVETIQGDALAESTVLAHERTASSFVGLPVSFMNASADGVAGFGVMMSGLVSGSIQYVPVLGIGTDSIIGDPISLSGGGGLFPDFGDESAPDRDGEATAQWLEVHVTVPGGEPVVVRRALFDRVGEATRAAGTFDVATLPDAELTTLVDGAPQEYLPARAMHLFAVLGGGVTGEYYGRATDPETLDVSLVAHTYHLAREILSADLGTDHGVRIFANAPHVVSHSIMPTGLAGDGELAVNTALDLWHRSVGLAGVPGSTPDAPGGIVAGVLTHVAERVALGEGLPVDATTPPVANLSVGAVFQAATEQGVPTRLLRGAMPGDLPYAAEALARIEAALASGLVVIAPERSVLIAGGEHIGWWLVDPVTGITTDQLEDGRGSEEGMEYGTTTSIPLTAEAKVLEVMQRYLACLAKYGATIGLLLGFEGEMFNIAGYHGLGAFLAGAATIAKTTNQLLNDPFFRALC